MEAGSQKHPTEQKVAKFGLGGNHGETTRTHSKRWPRGTRDRAVHVRERQQKPLCLIVLITREIHQDTENPELFHVCEASP